MTLCLLKQNIWIVKASVRICIKELLGNSTFIMFVVQLHECVNLLQIIYKGIESEKGRFVFQKLLNNLFVSGFEIIAHDDLFPKDR